MLLLLAVCLMGAGEKSSLSSRRTKKLHLCVQKVVDGVCGFESVTVMSLQKTLPVKTFLLIRFYFSYLRVIFFK